jgi:hypothetical protein
MSYCVDEVIIFVFFFESQSAGAVSVHLHILSKQSQGKFPLSGTHENRKSK